MDHIPQPFPTTRWSRIRFLREASGEEKRRALNHLLLRYRPALKTHLVCAMGFSPDKADDVVQEFIAGKIVEQDLVEKADQSRGKLRTLLRRALENCAMSVLRRENAQKRNPQNADVCSIERYEGPDPSENAPTDPFDAAWAREVIATALDQMKDYCLDSDRRDVWEVFRLRIMWPALDGRDPLPYGQLIQRFDLDSPSEAYNLLNTAKRIFRRHLRSVVGEYVESEEEIDDELRELRSVLSRSPALLDGDPT